ncbi:2TM domain-containing protein [Chryseobacterium sp.]|uniref:2TM domain-containing protein n=1 Tax=Chryseobacterium sp. TaxID=1871047 RepID=UPI002FC6CABC
MDYNRAHSRVQQLKKFYKNLMWFGIVAGIIIGNDFIKNGMHYNILSGHLILTIWAIFIIIKAVSLFVFDDSWEKEIINKEFKKEKKPIDF